MKNKLYAAMGAYAVLAILAGFTLDGKLRTFIWILLGVLAIKSYAAYRSSTLE